ncbi:hypothetical protein Afil01_19570 [Actinorhabdospora filicis]|uniref:Uncharacterized protein n=1 Tax=Actinorhabdospora filicis TaxID=1785913 RepID=A0A9W6WA04_9ACTN|nr:hypothetical protein [Actinorhabdospora filicis]GLZ77150.1 hypothetical protein Afil01_19570 [Actinorhabdospora filicis]
MHGASGASPRPFTDTFGGRLTGSLAVLGVVLAIALGLPALNLMIPGIEDVGGARVELGHGVWFTAPENTSRDVGHDRPNTVQLTVDDALVTATTRAYQRSAQDFAEAVREELKSRPGLQLTGSERSFATAAGVPGVRLEFHSPSQEGYLLILVHNGIAVDVTVSGNGRRGPEDGTYARLDDALATLTFDEARP